MNADILYNKIVEMEALKPLYRKGTGIAVDTLSLLFNISTEEVLRIALMLEAEGKVKIAATVGRSRNPIAPAKIILCQ